IRDIIERKTRSYRHHNRIGDASVWPRGANVSFSCPSGGYPRAPRRFAASARINRGYARILRSKCNRRGVGGVARGRKRHADTKTSTIRPVSPRRDGSWGVNSRFQTGGAVYAVIIGNFIKIRRSVRPGYSEK